MRFGWLAATAAVVCAGQASAETITQGFAATFLPVGSTGPVQVGLLSLGSNQVVQSATIFYEAETYLRGDFATLPGVTDPGSITYAGSVGFALFNVPVAVSASNAISGTQACAAGSCNLDFFLNGSLAIPTADLARFSSTTPVYVTSTGTLDYSIMYNGRSALLGQQTKITGVRGRIVYEVTSVPEPASWAMMLIGVGAVGYAARRRKATMQKA